MGQTLESKKRRKQRRRKHLVAGRYNRWPDVGTMVYEQVNDFDAADALDAKDMGKLIDGIDTSQVVVSFYQNGHAGPLMKGVINLNGSVRRDVDGYQTDIRCSTGADGVIDADLFVTQEQALLAAAEREFDYHNKRAKAVKELIGELKARIT